MKEACLKVTVIARAALPKQSPEGRPRPWDCFTPARIPALQFAMTARVKGGPTEGYRHCEGGTTEAIPPKVTVIARAVRPKQSPEGCPRQGDCFTPARIPALQFAMMARVKGGTPEAIPSKWTAGF